MLNVEVVSKETITPSSPTPANLRHLHLSFLDQLAPKWHIPIILFYSSDETAGKSIRLKKSLSKVLTRFYPLAGRIRQDDALGLHVECNDEGVEFYEARAKFALSEFLQKPSVEEASLLLPSMVSSDVPLAIQLNVLDCGGLAVGILLSHKIGDGTSLSMFITSWADSTQGEGNVDKAVSPTFNFASLFPLRSMKAKQEILTVKEKLVVKMSLIQASKIALLREKVEACTGLLPTRVEAISGLIWRCMLRSRGEAGVGRTPVAVHAVNIRGRLEPPLPEYSFGNLSAASVATGKPVTDDCDSDKVGHLERRLREAIKKMKGDSIGQLLENHDNMVICESSWNLFSDRWEECGFDFCTFSSWCRFPFYESDFGWGKPVWLSLVSIPIRNLVILLPTRKNEGIEAWVYMTEEEMMKFERDPELLAFVSHCI